MYYNRIANLECLSYTVEPVGFFIKKSKMIHQWTFDYKGSPHEIRLYDSKYTLNKEVLMDYNIVYTKRKTHQLDICFKLSDIDISLIQIGDEYDLRLNSCSFVHMLECSTNKKYFDVKERTSNVQYNQPSYSYYKQINNVLPLTDFTQHDDNESNKHRPLFAFSIHSQNENELNQRLII